MKKILVTSVLSFIFTFLSFILFPISMKASTDITNNWSAESNSLPYLLASHISIGFNSKLFVMNGSAQTYHSHNDVVSSNPGVLGSLTPWTYDTSYPKPMIWNSITSTSDYLYILGGLEEYDTPAISRFSDNYVYVSGKTNPLSWTATTSLPTRLSKGAATIANGYIYYTGGWTDTESDGTASNKVYYAQINGDGSLGSWSETTPLPNVLWSHGMLEGGGYVFIVGGTNGSGEKNNVYKAKVNGDGTLGLWETVSSLPTANRNFGIEKVGDYVFVVGGRIGTTFFNTVHYTTIDTGGNMSAWQTSANHLPLNNCCGSLAQVGGNLYLTGGLRAPGIYTNSVYRSALGSATPTATPTLTPAPTPTASPTATPSPTATASPTATPSPTASPTPLPNLNVPDIKQYSSPWKNQIYDSATNWSSTPTIEHWGCALTSASMILKFWGHGTYANPDNLNSWLKSQSDGYLGNGLINWLAVTRFSKLHSSSTVPSLEYNRMGPNETDLVSELASGRPAILSEPGHFIVAKSKTISSYGINDPAYSNRPTLDSYGNTFGSINSFTPSHTDLSYILLTIDPGFNLEVRNSQGTLIIGHTYIDGPIIDPFDFNHSSGQSIKIFEYPKPENGDYQISITGNGYYKLNGYIYDVDGNAYTSSFDGITPNTTDVYYLGINQSQHVIHPLTSIQNNPLINNKELEFIANKFRVINLLIKNKEYASANDVIVGLLRKILGFI